MKSLSPVMLVALLLMWGSGCACLKERAFEFDAPGSVVARAWDHIEKGYARDEGTFERRDLRLAQVDYARDGASVEVCFYILASFKTDAEGRPKWKTLDIEMDKAGKFMSASTADCSQGVASAGF
jgi:hypothetical protein